MNTSGRIATYCLASTLALAGVACSDDQPDTTPTSAPATTAAPPSSTSPDTTTPLYDIVGTALNGRVFGTLAGLVVDAALVDTLRSAGPFTVFAPTDDAFAKVPAATLAAVQGDKELLATVLTYHVVPGALTLADLQPGTLETVAGIPLEITREGDQVFINGSPIVAGDVRATNGVIHVMGDVLIPPS